MDSTAARDRKKSKPSDKAKGNATGSGSSGDAAASHADSSANSKHATVSHRPAPAGGARASENMHWREQPSPLSMEAGKQDYRGFLNLLVIIVVVMNARLVIENMLKYGLLISFNGRAMLSWETSWPPLVTFVVIFITGPLAAYAIEQVALARGKQNNASLSATLHTINVFIHFFFPLALIWFTSSSLGSNYILAFMCILLTMKLISYAHVSHDLRRIGARVAVFNSGMICAYDPASPPNLESLETRVRPAFARPHPHRRAPEFPGLAGAAAPVVTPPPLVAPLSLPNAASPHAAALNQQQKQQQKDQQQRLAPQGGLSLPDSDDAASLAASLGMLDQPTVPAPVPQKLSYEVRAYEPSLSHFYYYLAAPTLVFQLWYPRSARVRKSFVLRRLAELVFTSCLILFIVEQYVKPTLLNSLVYFDNGDIIPIVERVLKLCIPNTVVWLLIFYALFHSYLNLVAELMRFGDRVFYRDWWNSGDLGVYWRLWNRPVHDWLARHVYGAVLRAGHSSFTAKLVVFFLSALLHEVIVSVPCHIVSAQVFMAMFIQVPVIAVTQWVHRRSQNPVFGNVTFWCALCVFGQPLLILIYGYQYLRS